MSYPGFKIGIIVGSSLGLIVLVGVVAVAVYVVLRRRAEKDARDGASPAVAPSTPAGAGPRNFQRTIQEDDAEDLDNNFLLKEAQRAGLWSAPCCGL